MMSFRWSSFGNNGGDLVDNAGFSLIEVIIAIMVLSVAVVSATSVLTNVLVTNASNAEHVEGYYLAQEGIELVRNVRDTNWLHNLSFFADGVYPALVPGHSYSISLNRSVSSDVPVSVKYVSDFDSQVFDPFSPDFGILNFESVSGEFYEFSADKPSFYRHIDVMDYCPEGIAEDDCDDFVLIRSTVNWNSGSGGSVSLYAVFSDWKGGVL